MAALRALRPFLRTAVQVAAARAQGHGVHAHGGRYSGSGTGRFCRVILGTASKSHSVPVFSGNTMF